MSMFWYLGIVFFVLPMVSRTILVKGWIPALLHFSSQFNSLSSLLFQWNTQHCQWFPLKKRKNCATWAPVGIPAELSDVTGREQWNGDGCYPPALPPVGCLLSLRCAAVSELGMHWAREILWQCRGCQAPALEICDLSLEKKTPPHYAKKGKGECRWARTGWQSAYKPRSYFCRQL